MGPVEAFDAAGNPLAPGRPIIVQSEHGLLRARLHRTREGSHWMLIYEADGRVEFRDNDWMATHAAHVPF